RYAAAYDDKFLHAALARPDSEFEIATLAKLLERGGPWLDVACGTGYFLSQFANFERAGLDLSPSMLRLARARNPQASFHEGDFREPRPHWSGQWALVSCM